MCEVLNLYCDETGHLENDLINVMVLGYISCPAEHAREVSKSIKQIKRKHKISPYFEIKWVKVSQAKVDFYLDLVQFFFEDQQLNFRAVIIPDKSILRHDDFCQTHDDWYYKMYFNLIKFVINQTTKFNIYLDYKDTWGSRKAKILKEVLTRAYPGCYINRIQAVHSHESSLIQLTDLLIGAVSYRNRDLHSNKAKEEIISLFQKHIRFPITETTTLSQRKTNILKWHPGENA